MKKEIIGVLQCFLLQISVIIKIITCFVYVDATADILRVNWAKIRLSAAFCRSFLCTENTYCLGITFFIRVKRLFTKGFSAVHEECLGTSNVDIANPKNWPC